MMTKKLKLAVYPILSVSILILASCGNKHTPPKVPDVFCLTDTLMAHLNLVTTQNQQVRDRLHLSGKIVAHEDKMVKVYPLVGGIIDELEAELGDYVKKGQVLAIIRGREVSNLETELMTAQTELVTAQKNLSVNEDLFKSGLATERDVMIARKEEQMAESELKKIKDIINIYGVSNDVYLMRSPISGYVIERNPNITKEMQFDKETMGDFFTIADITEVVVEANVYETDIHKIQVGQDVNVHVIAYPDEIFKGKIDKIINSLDPVTRIMKVRINLPNRDNLLKPEMFAEAELLYQLPEQKIAVPTSSVIFDKNRYYVMVYHDRCDIETRPIETYQSNSDTTYISEGLKEGEKIMEGYHLLVYDALND